MKKILSIDGGGIRGIIPALILESLETKTGLPTAKFFDLVAGTSTGGILAMGLARPDDKDPSVPRYRAARKSLAFLSLPPKNLLRPEEEDRPSRPLVPR